LVAVRVAKRSNPEVRHLVALLQIYTAVSRARDRQGLRVTGLRQALARGAGGACPRAAGFYAAPHTYTGAGIQPVGTLWPPENDLQASLTLDLREFPCDFVSQKLTGDA